MAGSGHLQTFRLLRFLRSRNSADGHANYGIQMAVSFLFIYFIASDLILPLELLIIYIHCFYHILRPETQ